MNAKISSKETCIRSGIQIKNDQAKMWENMVHNEEYNLTIEIDPWMTQMTK